MTESAGNHAYTIQRAYIDDSATIAVGIQRDQLTINVGEVALVLSPLMARRLTAEIAVARMVHDMRYLEDGATPSQLLREQDAIRRERWSEDGTSS